MTENRDGVIRYGMNVDGISEDTPFGQDGVCISLPDLSHLPRILLNESEEKHNEKTENAFRSPAHKRKRHEQVRLTPFMMIKTKFRISDTQTR